MDGKETSTLHDPSTATQPLLSKPYSATLEPTIASTSLTEDDQTQYLQISYNYGPRSFKDLVFLILFCIFVLCTFGFGIFASVHRNPHRFSSFTYNTTSSSCTVIRDFEKSLPNDSVSEISAFNEKPTSLMSPKSNLLYGFIENQSFWHNPTSLNFRESSSILKSLIWTLVLTLILSGPFVFSVLLLLKHYTKQIVYAMLPFFVIIPILLDVYWFVACTTSSSCSDNFPLGYRIVVLVFVLLLIGVFVWIFIVNWHRIELTVKIIGIASNALSKNLGLFVVLPALTLALFVYYVPIVVFLVFANRNGNIVLEEENAEYFCVWKEDKWVPAYYALAILIMLWSAAAKIEAQVYVISGTIAQWYFSKDDSRPKRGIRSSLRNAFGTSSGTICLSGLLIAVVRIVRFMVDSARKKDGSGNSLSLSAVNFLNKFTLNFAAITGEGYCSAAKMTYELLKRNLLSTAFVEIVSTRILAGLIFVLSAIYAILVCVILKTLVHLGNDAYFVAFTAWILLIVVLGFFVHVLENVIETVYVCYAIDRDMGEVYKQDVHEVYVHLPINRSNVSRTPLV